jgi:hypothetical protein
LIRWPQVGLVPVALERAPLSFSRAPPSKPYTQILGSNPGRSTTGRTPMDGTSLSRKQPSWLRHSGARTFFACPVEQSPHAN